MNLPQLPISSITVKMKLSFTNALSVLSFSAAAIAAKAESNDASTIDLLVKQNAEIKANVEKLTAKIEALERQQNFPQKERRFLQSKSAKSSKATSTPTSSPTTSSSAALVTCEMTPFECSDLHNNVLNTQAHQTPDVYLTHTEQCQAFKFLLEKASEPTVANGLLKAMHCEAVPDVNTTEYEMILMSYVNLFVPVTDPDPYGPEYQACNGFINVGTNPNPDHGLPWLWFTGGYVADSFKVPLGAEGQTQCMNYCLEDPYCKAITFFKRFPEVDCYTIHVTDTISEGGRFTCGFSPFDCMDYNLSERFIYVKQEKDSNYCL